MKALIVEDDFISRRLMQRILSPHGSCDVAVDGLEAVQAVKLAFDEDVPYDLVCMDVMMPRMDGHQAAQAIRALERERGVAPSAEVKMVMTTALDDPGNVVKAYYHGGATSYFPKPIDPTRFIDTLKDLGLLG